MGRKKGKKRKKWEKNYKIKIELCDQGVNKEPEKRGQRWEEKKRNGDISCTDMNSL